MNRVSLSIKVIGLYILTGNLFAQTDNLEKLKTVAPPSPDAAALMKYSEWPVNLYTGVANIDIPIYELKGRSVSVPISLSYHSSGIKVGEIASSVGLGWSLNAGGMISRSVRGLPDDANYGGFFGFRTRYTDPNNFSSQVLSPYTLDQNKAQTADQQQDGEPDSYSLSAPGKSYKLIFKGDGSVITSPYSNVKITFAADSWTAVLEDGTKLVFGGTNFVETTSNARADISPYTSSWLLKSITSAVGEVVTFSYTPVAGVAQTAFISQKDRVTNNNNGSSAVTGDATCSCSTTGGNVGLGQFTQDQSIQVMLLTSIDSEVARVDLALDPSLRSDVSGGKFYLGIKVFSKLKNAYIEEYSLGYSYSQSVPSNGCGSASTYLSNRLHLRSLYRSDVVTHAPVQKWLFDYNPQSLPCRISYAQDHWGYFNGATQNTKLLPAIYTSQALYNGFNPDVFPGGNREPDATYMQAEMLNKITYPTGGYSQFVYEPNTFPKTEERFVKTTTSNDLTVSTSTTPFVLQKSMTITSTRPQFIKLTLDAAVGGLSGTPNMKLSALLKNSSGTVLAQVSLPNAGGSISKTFNVTQTGTLTYQIIATQVTQSDFSTGSSIVMNSTVTYDLSQGVLTANKMAGGLRIKSISDYESAGASPTIRNFVYESPMVMQEFIPENEYLTLLIQQLPVSYVDPNGKQVCSTNGSICFQNFLVRNSITKTFAVGAPIGYGKVTTLYGSNGENGKSVSIFASIADDGVTGVSFYPFPPTESRDWQRGQLLMKTDYDAGQNKISRVMNTYLPVYHGTITGMKSGRSTIYGSYPIGDTYTATGVTSVLYNISTGTFQLTSAAQVSYNGSDSLHTLTNYFYDNPNNLQALRTETNDSKGNLLKTINRTALEKSDINAAYALSARASLAIDSMLRKNMIGQVLQSEQYKASSLVHRSTVNHKIWYTSPTVIAPENVAVQIGSNAPETRVQFTDYDAKGNLREQVKDNAGKHAYLYDYTATYPIAEVVNADLASTAFTGFESDGAGNWSISSTVRDAATAFTGKVSFSLSGGNSISKSGLSASKAYLVTVWGKSGGSISANGAAITSTDARNGWSYYEKIVTGATTITITGIGNIDEARLFPQGALMTTYTYDPLIGITSMTDPGNLTTFYEYDGQNRLAVVRDSKRKVLKTYKYNYQ
jgi:YD repeat-containing protein